MLNPESSFCGDDWRTKVGRCDLHVGPIDRDYTGLSANMKCVGKGGKYKNRKDGRSICPGVYVPHYQVATYGE